MFEFLPLVFKNNLKNRRFSYSYKKRLGARGERIAGRYLARRGFSIVAKNYITKYGEIDIIAKKKNLIIFVEVKTRTDNKLGNPEDSVTYTKQRKINLTAKSYVNKNNHWDKDLRFDIISILYKGKIKKEIKWLQDAFRMKYRF